MQLIINEGVIEEKDKAKPPDTSAESSIWTPTINNKEKEKTE